MRQNTKITAIVWRVCESVLRCRRTDVLLYVVLVKTNIHTYRGQSLCRSTVSTGKVQPISLLSSPRSFSVRVCILYLSFHTAPFCSTLFCVIMVMFPTIYWSSITLPIYHGVSTQQLTTKLLLIDWCWLIVLFWCALNITSKDLGAIEDTLLLLLLFVGKLNISEKVIYI